jgi:hypothetical protein
MGKNFVTFLTTFLINLVPMALCEDEGRDEKALVWAGQFCILIG